MTHPSSHPDLAGALRARQFTLLDMHFQTLHAAHRRGTLTEPDLDAAYQLFNTYHADMTPHVQAWAAHSADYPAQVALGLHLFNRGLSLRTMRRA